jgi:transcriptional regulator with XRE-family HTH domain
MTQEKLSIQDLIKKYRTVVGLTQVQLAAQAGVSLPTVQNIELGKAKNPSLDVIERLCGVLGLRVEIRTHPCDWEYLAFCGVPFEVDFGSNAFGVTDLKRELSRALIELDEKRSQPKADALIGFFLALRDHYPDLLEQLGRAHLMHFLKAKKIEPRHFKLRQSAFNRLKKVL